MVTGIIEIKRQRIIELHEARPYASDQAIAERLGVSAGFVKRTRTVKAVPTIYALKCQSFIKIGSTRYLSSRIASIQTACPHPVELVNYWEFRSPMKTVTMFEKCWHMAAWEFKHLNEWFVDCVAFRRLIQNEVNDIERVCVAKHNKKWVMAICK
jgi:hypothetical protein